MEERILNAVSITELIALRKEVLETRYSDQDSEMFREMIDDRLKEIE